MSQWTHVAAIFRLDSFGKISDESIYKAFGKEVTSSDTRKKHCISEWMGCFYCRK